MRKKKDQNKKENKKIWKISEQLLGEPKRNLLRKSLENLRICFRRADEWRSNAMLLPPPVSQSKFIHKSFRHWAWASSSLLFLKFARHFADKSLFSPWPFTLPHVSTVEKETINKFLNLLEQVARQWLYSECTWRRTVQSTKKKQVLRSECQKRPVPWGTWAEYF